MLSGNDLARGAVQAQWPGQRADGSVLLPNQWSLRPVGQQIPIGDFPASMAVHPGGRYVAILHCGHAKHEVVVLDLRTRSIASRTPLDEAFYGIEFAKNGSQLFCSGSSEELVHQFTFRKGWLSNHHWIGLRPPNERGIPAGLTLSKSGKNLFVANVWGHRVSLMDVGTRSNIWELALGSSTNASSTNLVQPPRDPDLAAATKRGEALLEDVTSADPFPYACRLDEARQRLYVSLWAQSAVAVIDLKLRRLLATWPTEEHPNEMLLTKSGHLLYVANANRNTVTVIDTGQGRTVETLFASILPSPLPGATPNSLALSPDERTLFVANAANNNVAVFDVSTPGRSRAMGFIPVGWYPTSVRVTPDGKQLLVANGKGIISKPNPKGPQPGVKDKGTTEEYIGRLFQGTLSVIDLPAARTSFETQLRAYTSQAYACSPYLTNQNSASIRQPDNPVPARPGDPSPIKYCIYVIKENRTYDQVFGDMPEGNGDPKLCLFPERVTPNHHALAREFVLLDNFYVEAEVSADGHEWTMGAYATDFVEKMWPLNYGHNKSGKIPYPSEGRFQIATPAGGYLWDRAREAGVSYRSYGEFIDPPKTNQPATSRVAALRDHFDEGYRPWDLDYPDVKRAERFLEELKRFEREGEMPRLQIVRLPNDHTYGTSAGKLTPTAMMGDNDLAFGMFVEGVSHSKFWPQTAIFVIEDDAQNGPDHVDAHRSIAFVISPYTKRRAVDSTMYSTSSMLRTMELILGLQPMSQFDAAAMPMFNSFQPSPDVRPYKARQAAVDLNERNPKTAWGSDKSKRMNFSKEDAADDLMLNEVIWRSVRGADSPMPAPTRAAFVFTRQGKDADD